MEISYVEFFCGVGGWTMALEEAIEKFTTQRVAKVAKSERNGGTQQIHRLRRIAALDHSTLCTHVFAHNFCASSERLQSSSIERLSLEQAEKWEATIWMMSPPCQPHTRQHQNQDKDVADPRSASFLHICDLLSKMRKESLPSLLFLENVIGFELSRSFQRWRQVLSHRGYHVGHFHLTPTQVGWPNDRPRYFCVAVHCDHAVVDLPSQGVVRHEEEREDDNGGGTTTPPPFTISTEIPHLPGVVRHERREGLPPLSCFLDPNSNASLRVPEQVLQKRAAWCFDIVTPSDQRSSCFTQSYGSYIKGTGSVLYEDATVTRLALVPPEEREFQQDWAAGLDLSKLRYFSGTEMARLFGFRDTFSFPEDCSRKQQWKLLGNSLNVRLASSLVEFGLGMVLKNNHA